MTGTAVTYAEGRLEARHTTADGRTFELHLDLGPVLLALAMRRARKG